MAKQFIGKIVHFFDRLSVAVIQLTADLEIGDVIMIENHQTGETFEQPVDSMQIDKKKIDKASAGDDVGLQVVDPVAEKDLVYKITE